VESRQPTWKNFSQVVLQDSGFPPQIQPSGRATTHQAEFRDFTRSTERKKEQVVSLEEKVIAIVSEQLSVSADEIKAESSLIDDLHADSLDLVELGMKFEESFGVAIADEDQEKIKSVGDAIEYIRARENG